MNVMSIEKSISKYKGKLYHWVDRSKIKRLNKKSYIHIGENTYGIPKVHFGIDEGTELFIGKFCSIGKGCHIYLGGNHRLDWITTYPFYRFYSDYVQIDFTKASKGNVVIENDVWIGANVTILSGVKIGNGAVIGACSVVTKDIPAYAVAVGNPARIIRFRFGKEEIKKLEEIEWWNWDWKEIYKEIPKLLSNDLKGLFNK
jgi:Acetyltransferase (isoleucine patch superfamily)